MFGLQLRVARLNLLLILVLLVRAQVEKPDSKTLRAMLVAFFSQNYYKKINSLVKLTYKVACAALNWHFVISQLQINFFATYVDGGTRCMILFYSHVNNND